MKIGVLGIGTELTSGQILNKNAQWISAQLKNRGFEVTHHLVVPDQRELILNALDFCKEQVQILFITGGLGPTSDDFTRPVMADYLQAPLQYDEESWNHVTQRLQSRGIPVRENQKQQCYFPKGSKILINDQGTANGFTFEKSGSHYFVLPGPPKEIEAIWQKDIIHYLEKWQKNLDPLITVSWDCMGASESEIAHQVTNVTMDFKYDIGYRVHLPYIEVKLTFPFSKTKEAEPFQKRIDQVLERYIAGRNGSDIAIDLGKILENFDRVTVVDEVTGYFLVGRLSAPLKNMWLQQKVTWSPHESVFHEGTLYLVLNKISDHQAEVEFVLDGLSKKEILSAPYSTELMKERNLQFIAEKAMFFWKKELEQET
jgi:nicotinamide-nucleotide amidase